MATVVKGFRRNLKKKLLCYFLFPNEKKMNASLTGVKMKIKHNSNVDRRNNVPKGNKERKHMIL